MAKIRNDSTEIPKHDFESLARCLLPEMLRYFDSEDGKREFEEWKAVSGGYKGTPITLRLGTQAGHFPARA